MDLRERWESLRLLFEQLKPITCNGTLQNDRITVWSAFDDWRSSDGARFAALSEQAGDLLSETPGLAFVPGVDAAHRWYHHLIDSGVSVEMETITGRTNTGSEIIAACPRIKDAQAASAVAILRIVRAIDQQRRTYSEPDEVHHLRSAIQDALFHRTRDDIARDQAISRINWSQWPRLQEIVAPYLEITPQLWTAGILRAASSLRSTDKNEVESAIKSLADADEILRIACITGITGGAAAEVPPVASANASITPGETAGQNFDEILFGWPQILTAIGQNVKNEPYIKRLNKEHGGPVVTRRGAQATASKSALLAWWADVSSRLTEKLQQATDLKNALMAEFGESASHFYGAGDARVLPESGSSIRKRRKTPG